jgi:hypothetical protein
MNTFDKEREDVEALLPWHAAGTLSRRDAERVEKALLGDRELARRCDLAREELDETILLNEMLGAPSGRAFENPLAAIDAEPAPRARVAFGLASRLAALVSSFSPGTLALTCSAAALAIVLHAGAFATYPVKQQAGQGNELASAGVTTGTLAVIRFAPHADAGDITRFLAANKASVVDGPKTGAIYSIRLPETGQAKDDLIKRMQAQSAIVELISPVQ